MAQNLADLFGLDRCIECGACSDACPSARNGGIRPDATVSAVRDNGTADGVWRCLQCHRCAMVCPQEIDVSGMIAALRNISSDNGDAPERFIRTGKQVCKTGKTFVIAGRTESQRKDLGLSTEPLSDESLAKMRKSLKEAGFDYE